MKQEVDEKWIGRRVVRPCNQITFLQINEDSTGVALNVCVIRRSSIGEFAYLFVLIWNSNRLHVQFLY